MRKVEKGTDRYCHRGSIWQLSIAAIMSFLFVSPFPFSRASGFLRTHAADTDSAAVSTATVEGRLAVFDDVWQTVNDRYYDANFHGVDWWAQRAQLRTPAADAHNPAELYTILRRL